MRVLGSRMVKRVKNKIIKKLPFNLRNAEKNPNQLKLPISLSTKTVPKTFLQAGSLLGSNSSYPLLLLPHQPYLKCRKKFKTSIKMFENKNTKT